MSVSTDLDNRFREAAARSGLLDAGYDLVDSPLGRLLVAASDRGILRISFDPTWSSTSSGSPASPGATSSAPPGRSTGAA